MPARSFMGSGDVLIEAIINGVGQGLEGPFKANKLALKPNVTRFQSVSKGRYDRGQVLETVSVQQPTDLTLELQEVVGNTLAYAMLGTTAVLSAPAGALSAQAINMRKGKWVPVGAGILRLAASQTVTVQTARTGTFAAVVPNVGNFTCGTITVANNTRPGVYNAIFTSATAFNVTDPAGAAVGAGTVGTAFSAGGLGFTITAGGTAAVAGDDFTITVAASGSATGVTEGTDYELNRPLGLIRLLSTSAQPDYAVFSITGAYAGAPNSTRIRGATQPEVRCRILFDGINQADGSEVTAEVYEAVLAVDSEFDFLPDDFGVVSLTGTVKTPTGRTEPFVVDTKPV